MQRIELKSRVWTPYFVVPTAMIIFIGNILIHYPQFGSLTYKTVYAALTTLVFLAGYCLLRPFSTLSFWKFVVFIVATIVCNDVRNYIYYDWMSGHLSRRQNWAIAIIWPYSVSIITTFLLFKYLFGFDNKKAALLGVLVGMILVSAFRLCDQAPFSY